MTPEVRQRLAAVAEEARLLVYGSEGCPVWGTTLAEIEDDAREVGHGFMRLMMSQSNARQADKMPQGALQTDSGEIALAIDSEDHTLETEAGRVSWSEPKAYLPKSRKAFFPSVEGAGPECR